MEQSIKKLLLLSISSIVLFSSCIKTNPIQTQTDPLQETAAGKTNPPSSPNILQWQKTYGSQLNEMGYTITKANDGSGFVFVGSALGNGGDITGYKGGIGADAWVVKVDNSGAIQWKKCIGGTNSDYADEIIATSDGGYVFAGNTKSNDGDVLGNHGGAWDIWLVKLDASGGIVWEKTIGGSGDDQIGIATNSLLQTTDGGFLLTASTNSTDGDVSFSHGGTEAWVVKLDGTGNISWQKTYGGTLSEGANTIIFADNGNYMIAGSAASTDGDLMGQQNHGGTDCWIFKINDNGDLLWQKTYGGSQNESVNNIRQASDGSYVFSSTTVSNDGDVSGNHGYADTWVVKIKSDGSITWKKCFGGNDMDNASVRDIDASGSIVLAGYTFSRNGDITGFKGSEDLWVLQLDANGNKLSSTVLGGKAGDMAQDVVANSDGSYTSIGRTNSTDGNISYNQGGGDIWLVKFKF